MKKRDQFHFCCFVGYKIHFSPLISFPSSPLLPLYFFKPNMYLSPKKRPTSKLEKSTQNKIRRDSNSNLPLKFPTRSKKPNNSSFRLLHWAKTDCFTPTEHWNPSSLQFQFHFHLLLLSFLFFIFPFFLLWHQ